MMLRLLALAMAALVAFSLPAAAHRIVASAYVTDGEIEGEVGFSDGSMAMGNTRVEVLGPDDAPLGETVTDDAGIFRFKASHRIDHTFVVDLGAGHIARVTVAAEDLPASLGEAPVRAAPASSPAPVASPAPAALPANAVEAAVAAQIKPLRKELAQFRNEILLRDILGGLGYILGLTGLGFYFLARRRNRT